MKKVLTLLFFTLPFCPFLLSAQNPGVFINEVNYLTSNPLKRGIEIAGEAGSNMNGWSAVFYNPSGMVVASKDLSGEEIPDQENGYGSIWYDVIQNYQPSGGGVALVNSSGGTEQFVSYGLLGLVLEAVEGPASGMTAQFIGVQLLPSKSLQLTGIGISYLDFLWALPGTATPDDVNINQWFGQLLPLLFMEGNQGQGSVEVQGADFQSIVFDGDTGFEWTVFPNPVADHLEVRLSKNVAEDTQVELYDFQGRLVGSANVGSEFNSVSFEMAHLPAGPYVVKVGKDSKLVVKR